MDKQDYQKSQRGSMYQKKKNPQSDRRSLIFDIHNYIQVQPKWAETSIDLYTHRVSFDGSNQNILGLCDKRTSMSTEATLSTELGSNPLLSMYDKIEVDQPIEELSSQSDESEVSYSKKNKKKKKKDEPPQRFKTEMCKNWSLMGKCNYGKKCQFAHGPQELCSKPEAMQNNKYKSKLCKSFHEDNVCYYGGRCQFIHENRTIDQIRKSYARARSASPNNISPINPVISKDNRRLSSLVHITADKWNLIPYKICLQEWVRKSQGLFIQLSLSSSSE